MSDKSQGKLQIMIFSGVEDGHRATLAFATAVAAATSGIEVVIFLVMRGAVWGSKNTGNEVLVPGFNAIADYIDILQESAVPIEICSTCVDNSCLLPMGKDGLRAGIVPAGLTSFAIRTDEWQTLTF